MTPGEALVASVPLKTDFYDRHERRAYLRAIEVAKHIVDDPRALRTGSEFLEKHYRSDPHRRAAYEVWRALLAQPPEAIARALLDDSERGAELRGSAPVFVVLSGEARLEMLR